MVTLAKRATPSQARILRIIEGAVLNTADAHGFKRDERLARSVAKRAAGTLTAQWPEVLAGKPPKSGPVVVGYCRTCERRRHLAKRGARLEHAILTSGVDDPETLYRDALRGSSHFNRRLPLLELWDRLKREMWHVSRSDDAAKIEAYRNLLRMIDRLHRDLITAQLPV